MSLTTGAMQEFGRTEPNGAPISGLVLLYADAYPALPPAVPLPRARFVIGREAPCDLVLPVPAVSRIHADLIWNGSSFEIRDLNSRNGILVNGQRVTQDVLETYDEIRIGDAIFKFVEEDAEEYARYRIDGSLLPGRTRYATRQSRILGGYRMDRIIADLERIARSELSVLVLGPSGTGKEVVATELHRLSDRTGPFVALNCAAIPANLLESELFGFKRGAFSGADRDKPGLIRSAEGGTLLLDEIGDMPLEAQAKLLRVIQSKEVLPLGATHSERVDVRFVCATHRDLRRALDERRFREDLFARLNEYQLRLPPLHERKEDIFALMRAFQSRHGGEHLTANIPFMVALLHHDWPQNVRELEATIKRAIALSRGPVLDVDLLPDAVQEAVLEYGKAPGPQDFPSTLAGSRKPNRPPTEAELRTLLSVHAGNVAAVGRALGKARMQIHRWMRRYGIEIEDYRP